MSQIKKKHIRSKTIWQIFMMFLEIAVIVGGLTLGSSLLWEFESGLDILERVGLFYGFYQILTYIILSNLNDIKADEFLALKNTASIALKSCEYNDEAWKGILNKYPSFKGTISAFCKQQNIKKHQFYYYKNHQVQS